MKFWMNWVPEKACNMPTKQFFDKEEAKQEAERLARKERTQVYLLECIATAAPKPFPIEWKEEKEEI